MLAKGGKRVLTSMFKFSLCPQKLILFILVSWVGILTLPLSLGVP